MSPREGEHKQAAPWRFSVVSAVYNVEKYLDDYFSSITSQSLDFKSNIELVMVDDGSGDRSAKIVKAWQKKYPKNIKYLRKPNGGVASAKNLGLPHATGEWVTFIDPDDFVDAEYFFKVQKAILDDQQGAVGIVNTNLIFYYEATQRKEDRHPLRFRFASGRKSVRVGELGRDIMLSDAAAFFRRQIIVDCELSFDANIRPAFEDAHFIGRYLAALSRDDLAVFLPEATYFYRKRGDQSSLVDTSSRRVEYYTDQLRFGFLGLLRAVRGSDGVIPRVVQNTVFYDLTWLFQHLVDRPDVAAFLSAAQKRECLDLLLEIFALIDAKTVTEYDITAFPLLYRVGIFGRFKGADPPDWVAEVTGLDVAKDLVRVVYWSRRPNPAAAFFLDGDEVAPRYTKTCRHEFLGGDFVSEHIFWIPLGGAKTLQVHVEGVPARIATGGGQPADHATTNGISLSFSKRIPDPTRLEPAWLKLRQHARQPDIAARFKDAWLFMDRDTGADDNAEHMYRYVRATRPEINAFFVLRRTAADWARLERDAFRLVKFGELDHILALLNASRLVSSQVDEYVATPLPPHGFADMTNYKLVFLQHGIIHNDLSRWLNDKAIDCFVTSTPAEFRSIVEDGSSYKFGKKEVVLTGMPRHDALLEGKKDTSSTILIMPTWRSSLAGPVIGYGSARATNPKFSKSDFVRRWKQLFHSERLATLAKQVPDGAVLLAHPDIEQYMSVFDIPDWLELRRLGRGDRPIQRSFQEASVFVTDYSSTAFEAAYLGKPVLYYQFDRGSIFNGAHTPRQGYFDYERDGFGSVCEKEDTLIDAIEAIVIGRGPDPKYRARADRTFLFRDGKCCERVFHAIQALDQPPTDAPERVTSEFAAAD